jgi:uncharacterized protein with HEPN domain
MSRHDVRISLAPMRDHAKEALAIARGKTRGDLDSNRMLNLSLVKLLEIVGEAANRVSTEERAKYVQIPWPQLITLRHWLIHGYDQVDFDILWEIITVDLPSLVVELERIVDLEAR